MTAISFLLACFDDIESHRWESTESVLEGLQADEAEWRHPAWEEAEQATDLPPVGTVLWHIAHLEYCTRYYAEVLRNRPITENPSVPPPSDLSFQSLPALFAAARAEFRAELARLTDADLDAPCRPGVTVGEFVRAVFRHESWHGGQIAVVRRLYRERHREESRVAGSVRSGNGRRSILGLHHAQITVPGEAVEEARRFYCELLGLPEVPKPESLRGRGGFWFGAGDRDVHVGIEEGVDRHRTKAHLAYQVEGLEEWRDLLQSNGIEIPDSVPIPGYDRFEFRDPFGNRVEFIQAQPDASGGE